MMFLLKLTFWIMLICLILPGSREDNRKLMASAEKTFDDVGSFCSRNPDVCANARSAVTSLLSRVKNGAELVEGWVRTSPADSLADYGSRTDDTGYETHKRQDRPYGNETNTPRVAPQWNNSLSPTDRQPAWRGPNGL